MCITPVRSGSYGRRSRHGVRQWGPCSRVGEAGRPGGQRRSVMTTAAVGVSGLALWRGHPAHRCPALCVHRAAAVPSSIAITSVSPCLLRTWEMGWWGGGRRRWTYPPVSRSQSKTSVNDTHPWKLYTPPGMCAVSGGDVMYVCHSIRRHPGRTDGDNVTQNVRPLTLKPTLNLYDLLWTCCWCAVLDLVFVQNGERRGFGWRTARL